MGERAIRVSAADKASEPIDTIVDGVFFTQPGRLPRGPHRLDRDTVLAAQRERFLIAFTELVAAHGFAKLRVSDVTARSGTSKTAFYDCFDSLDQCAKTAYARFVEVLLQRMTEYLAGAHEPRDVTAPLLAYLQTLQQDPVVARAFQLELYNEGRFGREQRRIALRRFAELIRSEHLALVQRDPAHVAEHPLEVYLGLVYAVRQLASDALDTERTPDLVGLVPRLRAWIAAGLGISQ
ncbi:TetR/AcrR family transcriptional regulator [Nocardia huaxiensis]|uniref:TetR/AcrR family transcriptional regulator n=1 Tax=Nocardia huaxiensis TaxID=2755382 RepID=UPI001C68383E|nr:TetR/AcrR family transcriptional regulator [Nocardia huaxiensis]UFS98247.1 TetR/AcrR family transcriptional regulator [Nocardia huaxiensis]